MAHRPEGGDEQVNVLRAPARLREGKQRQNQQRRADVENEVTPAAQNPRILFRHSRCHGRMVCGGEKAVTCCMSRWLDFPDSDEKSTLHSVTWRLHARVCVFANANLTCIAAPVTTARPRRTVSATSSVACRTLFIVFARKTSSNVLGTAMGLHRRPSDHRRLGRDAARSSIIPTPGSSSSIPAPPLSRS